MRTFPVALTAILALASAAPAQGVLYYEDFEQGTANWILGGFWNAEAETDACGSLVAPFPAGPNAIYCGRNGICNYEGAPLHHELRSLVDVLVPATGHTWLRYKSRMTTENLGDGVWDRTYTLISLDGGATFNQLASDDQEYVQDPLWRRSRVPIQLLAGSQHVRIGFALSSQDGNLDNFFGWIVDGVEIRNEPGEPFCDAALYFPAPPLPCPCGNGPFSGMGAPFGGGCSRANGIGAELLAEGTASIAASDTVLVARDMPASTFAVIVLGTPLATPTAFGDGVRCLGGSQSRLVQRAAVGGMLSHPQPSGIPLHVQSGVTQPGTSSNYQTVYRDASNYCTAATFNTTNAYRITWAP